MRWTTWRRVLLVLAVFGAAWIVGAGAVLIAAGDVTGGAVTVATAGAAAALAVRELRVSRA